jgi:hypothetical protein
MSYFNSTKVKWNFSYCDCFTLKRENSPDFLCMNAMHTSVSSIFVTPIPGILQSLPLKLNFVLEVWSLSRFRSVDLTCADLTFLELRSDLTGYNWIYTLSRFFLESIRVCLWTMVLLSPEYDRARGRPRSRWAWRIYMEGMHESALYAKFGLVRPCICNIVGYVSVS